MGTEQMSVWAVESEKLRNMVTYLPFYIGYINRDSRNLTSLWWLSHMSHKKHWYITGEVTMCINDWRPEEMGRKLLKVSSMREEMNDFWLTETDSTVFTTDLRKACNQDSWSWHGDLVVLLIFLMCPDICKLRKSLAGVSNLYQPVKIVCNMRLHPGGGQRRDKQNKLRCGT